MKGWDCFKESTRNFGDPKFHKGSTALLGSTLEEEIVDVKIRQVREPSFRRKNVKDKRCTDLLRCIEHY